MKNNLKRMLSVFMAALMLMTCWVFVAPQKAEAVNSGTYYWRVRVNSSNDTGGWDQGDWTVYGKPNNGTGSEVSIGSFSQYINFNENGKIVGTGNSTSFPTKVTFKYSFGGGITHRKMDATIYLDVSGNNSSWTQVGSATAYSYEWGTNSGTITLTGGNYPIPGTVNFSQNPGNITIPTSGNATTTFRTYLTDQYGVKVTSSASSYTKSASLNYTTGCSVAYGSTTNDDDPATITVNNNAKMAGTTNTKTVTLTVSYNFAGKTAVSGTKTFTLTDPQYTFTYNGNGGTVNQSSYKTYYGNPAATIPTGGSRTGYEYIGMYSPAKTDSYATTKPVAGSTSGYTGQLTTSTAVNSDTTYYAAWWAKNVTVTFKNNDGSVVGSVMTGKYDKSVSGAGLTAPTDVQYVKEPGATGTTYDYQFAGWRVVEAKKYNANGTQSEYNDIIGQNATAAVLKGDTVFMPIYDVVKRDYKVKFYNGSSTPVSSKEDYHYRDTITQPSTPAKAADDIYTYSFKGWTEIPTNGTTYQYVVDENGKTDGGVVIPLVDDADFIVRRDISYAAVFEKVYIPYTVHFNYDGVNDKTVLNNVHIGDTMEVPTPAASYTAGGYRYTFVGWYDNAACSGSAVTPSTFNGTTSYFAKYTSEPAVYEIQFYDYDDTAILPEGSTSFDHGASVVYNGQSADAYAEGQVTQTYRDDSYEYTFTGWSPEFNSIAGADVAYKAQYEAAPLYTINYYNGEDLLGSVKEVAGKDVPAYDGEIPTKAADAYALDGYTFSGWKDEHGDEIDVMPPVDINLYAQYDCTPTVYFVTFKNDLGTVISSGDYFYGEEITIPTETDAAKPDDKTYHYEFIGWDNDPSETCTGNATYTAQYRKSYIYYPVVWENEDETTFKTGNYIYNEIMNPPYEIPTTAQISTDPNYEYVFAGWKYKETDEDFVRGDRMKGGNIVGEDGKTRLYPVFELAANICEVTLYDADGTTVLQTLEIPFDTSAADMVYSTPIKEATDTEHYNFAGWVNMDGTAWAGIVDGDISLKASYTAEAHNYNFEIHVETYPTFFEEGRATLVCSCGKEKADEVIPAIADTTEPTSKLYVGKTNWTEAQATNNEPIPTAATNILILNGDDKAEVSTYNSSGTGCGVDTISFYIAKADSLPASAEDITDWNTRFDYDDVIAHGFDLSEANATGYIGDAIKAFFPDGFEDGQEYVVYGKMVDRLGNVSYINSPMLKFDASAPAVTVESECFNGNKHCVDATISVTSDDTAKVTLDGTAITLDADGKYLVETAGQHQVVVTDLAGNISKVSFQVIGSHNTKTYTVDPTCTEDGYTVEKCLLCGNEIGAKVIIPTEGHSYTDKVVEPTCLVDGYTKHTCSKCGDTYTDSIVPATGEHTWNDGVVITDATCIATGSKLLTCTVCGETTIDTIAIDPDAHSFYRPVTTKPTCTDDGKVEKTCKYCGYAEIIETLPATGHEAGGEWVVTVQPTCTEAGTKVQYCKNCDTTEVQATDTVPALGHKLVIDHVVPPTATEQGYTVYKCERCTYTENGNYVDPLETFTVSFVDEDKATELASFTKAAGETITAADIETPTKAADETYTYTFAGWKNAADDNAVALPITVSGNLTVYATYTEKYINYTVTLYKEDGTTEFDKVGYKHYGDTVEKAGPVKAADDYNTYVFAGWVPLDNPTAEPITVITVTKDADYKAAYTATPKTYTVTWAIDADHVLEVQKNVVAGTSVSYTKATPVKEGYDDYGHYVFDCWSAETTNVSSDLYVTAKFKQESHSYTDSPVAATCTTGSGTKHTCACGYSYVSETGPALGHKWIVTNTVNPTPTKAGREDLRCERCGETSSRELPATGMIKVTVNVKDQHGKPVSGAKVSLYDGSTLVAKGTTGGNGSVVLEVPEAKGYRLEIEGVGSSNVTVNANGTITGTIPTVHVKDECTCACHRDGLWGNIFRFFHKIIKMLVGDFVCCGDPDPRYGA